MSNENSRSWVVRMVTEGKSFPELLLEGHSSGQPAGQNKKQELVLVRGLPGSGKSTLAKQISEEGGHKIFSTDDFFVVGGRYHFDFRQLSANHQKNVNRTIAALKKDQSVIVDNTNAMFWEMRPYVVYAVENNIPVRFTGPDTYWAFDVVECARRNSHGVPEKTVRNIFKKWESGATINKVLAATPPPDKR